MRTYRLHGWFEAPDVRYSDDATLDVVLAVQPTEADAGVLLRPVVDAKVRAYYDDDYRWDFVRVSVEAAGEGVVP